MGAKKCGNCNTNNLFLVHSNKEKIGGNLCRYNFLLLFLYSDLDHLALYHWNCTFQQKRDGRNFVHLETHIFLSLCYCFNIHVKYSTDIVFQFNYVFWSQEYRYLFHSSLFLFQKIQSNGN